MYFCLLLVNFLYIILCRGRINMYNGELSMGTNIQGRNVWRRLATAAVAAALDLRQDRCPTGDLWWRENEDGQHERKCD